ncbi:616_t:CDS:2, partial [Funneliformis mosseae]
MSNLVIDSDVRTYRFKRKKYPFFMNTDASMWSFQRFYSTIIHSGDAPNTFNEIHNNWTASLKFIMKQKSVPESIVNFVRELIEFNSSKEFENLRDVFEQDFYAHVLATISSESMIKSTMTKGYMMQTNEILNSTLGKQGKKNEEDEDAMQDSNKVHSDDEFTEISPTRKNNLKRKLENDELPGYDRLAFLFNDSNEDTIINKIDENTLEDEIKLPQASDNKSFHISLVSLYDYESLHGCKEITENNLQQLSQDFADHIKWKCEPVPRDIQDYFDSSCEKLDNSNENKELKHFDTNVQF